MGVMNSNRKTALVTGGTSGVGLSIVRALAKEGACVYFLGTNRARGKEIEEALGERARFVPVDLSNLAATRRFAEQFKGEHAKLDLLANVAGVMLPKREETEEGNDKTFAIDHLSAVVLSDQLAPLLAKAEHGRIANVSGPPSQMLRPLLDFDDLQLQKKYSVVRAVINALHAKTVMTEIMAERLKPDGIDVIAFDPGAIKSSLARHTKFPMNLVMGAAHLFMSADSVAGIFASTSETLNGVTGQLVVGRKPRPLKFERSYKDRLWAATLDQLRSSPS